MSHSSTSMRGAFARTAPPVALLGLLACGTPASSETAQTGGSPNGTTAGSGSASSEAESEPTLTVSGGSAVGTGDAGGSRATLLFRSGFEEGVYLERPTDVEPNSAYQFLRGMDEGFAWPPQVLGASASALHLIAHDDLNAVTNEIQTVTGHDGNPTRALYNAHHYAHDGVTQSPYELLDLTNGTGDLYIRYWMKISEDYLDEVGADASWRAVFEWKSEDYATDDGFRLIAFIYTDSDDPTPYWVWQGDADPGAPIWEIENRDVPVPIGEWFLTEYYWHWSEGEDGRALWRINGEVIGDHFGPTTRDGKTIDFIIMTQIYGSVAPKYQWIDDVEIWDGIP